MRLSEVCDIQTGYTARGRLEAADADGVPVITLRDFGGDGVVRAYALQRVKLQSPDQRYYVGAGDVVFRSRGEKNTAFALGSDFQESSVAVLPLMIIRSKTGNIIPEYLAWLINSPRSQSYFDAEAQGTNMRMISKSALDDLDILIPEVSVQQKIVEVAGLASRERELLSNLADKRARLVSASLMNIVENFGATTQKGLSQ
ncbi:restriction endonuclease subunit S [Roseibium aggregatum]|uniref:Restriction endonuclease subunit S n=1 Tax=Roseibium aggregatum TaxID=187304 RepID=A0A926P4V9_9HYPH|nr:restriction endonuclease subunit S [Roseibium aggregatum]MBD1549598.1 restriction endonuclease subunit S [Roseibium aggregatum]